MVFRVSGGGRAMVSIVSVGLDLCGQAMVSMVSVGLDLCCRVMVSMLSDGLDLGGRGYGVRWSGPGWSRLRCLWYLLVWTWVVGATVSMVSGSMRSGYGVYAV
eukprot:2613574-Karenia_brevis.AAC.1